VLRSVDSIELLENVVAVMDQASPITREDVLRIIVRDFPRGQTEAALAQLDKYGNAAWHGEKVRVQLAILKLSRGNLEQIKLYVAIAQRDFRSAIAMAECPQTMQFMRSHESAHSAAALSNLRAVELQQYAAWFHSNEFAGGIARLPASEVQPKTDHQRARRKFPGWLGPVIGPIAGVFVVLRSLDPNQPGNFILVLIATGAGLGFVGGLIVWVADRCRS
jgi:hypothetical protein